MSSGSGTTRGPDPAGRDPNQNDGDSHAEKGDNHREGQPELQRSGSSSGVQTTANQQQDSRHKVRFTFGKSDQIVNISVPVSGAYKYKEEDKKEATSHGKGQPELQRSGSSSGNQTTVNQQQYSRHEVRFTFGKSDQIVNTSDPVFDAYEYKKDKGEATSHGKGQPELQRSDSSIGNQTTANQQQYSSHEVRFTFGKSDQIVNMCDPVSDAYEYKEEEEEATSNGTGQPELQRSGSSIGNQTTANQQKYSRHEVRFTFGKSDQIVNICDPVSDAYEYKEEEEDKKEATSHGKGQLELQRSDSSVGNQTTANQYKFSSHEEGQSPQDHFTFGKLDQIVNISDDVSGSYKYKTEEDKGEATSQGVDSYDRGGGAHDVDVAAAMASQEDTPKPQPRTPGKKTDSCPDVQNIDFSGHFKIKLISRDTGITKYKQVLKMKTEEEQFVNFCHLFCCNLQLCTVKEALQSDLKLDVIKGGYPPSVCTQPGAPDPEAKSVKSVLTSLCSQLLSAVNISSTPWNIDQVMTILSSLDSYQKGIVTGYEVSGDVATNYWLAGERGSMKSAIEVLGQRLGPRSNSVQQAPTKQDMVPKEPDRDTTDSGNESPLFGQQERFGQTDSRHQQTGLAVSGQEQQQGTDPVTERTHLHQQHERLRTTNQDHQSVEEQASADSLRGKPGGSGSDNRPGDSGSDNSPGGSGSDRPGGSGSYNRPGGSGSDNRPGGSESDNRPGGSGSDSINRPGCIGSDSINRPGGSGSDSINRPGGSGSDNRPGGSGSDTRTGGSGSDNRPGGSGSDNRPGGSGSYNRPGGSGSDNISGGSGSDNRPGGSGSDNMPGGRGSDNRPPGLSGAGDGHIDPTQLPMGGRKERICDPTRPSIGGQQERDGHPTRPSMGEQQVSDDDPHGTGVTKDDRRTDSQQEAENLESVRSGEEGDGDIPVADGPIMGGQQKGIGDHTGPSMGGRQGAIYDHTRLSMGRQQEGIGDPTRPSLGGRHDPHGTGVTRDDKRTDIQKEAENLESVRSGEEEDWDIPFSDADSEHISSLTEPQKGKNPFPAIFPGNVAYDPEWSGQNANNLPQGSTSTLVDKTIDRYQGQGQIGVHRDPVGAQTEGQNAGMQNMIESSPGSDDQYKLLQGQLPSTKHDVHHETETSIITMKVKLDRIEMNIFYCVPLLEDLRYKFSHVKIELETGRHTLSFTGAEVDVRRVTKEIDIQLKAVKDNMVEIRVDNKNMKQESLNMFREKSVFDYLRERIRSQEFACFLTRNEDPAGVYLWIYAAETVIERAVKLVTSSVVHRKSAVNSYWKLFLDSQYVQQELSDLQKEYNGKVAIITQESLVTLSCTADIEHVVLETINRLKEDFFTEGKSKADVLVELTQNKEKKPKIVLHKGDIAKMTSDVIVNTTDKGLKLNVGAVSASILREAGPEIQKECDWYYRGVKFGEVAITHGYRLKCKHVFHGALPLYEKDPQLKYMESYLLRCLTEADKKNYSTISFPAMGTGNLGYPRDLVAKTMFDTINDYFNEGRDSSIETVSLVVYPKDEPTVKAFEDEEKKRRQKVLEVQPSMKRSVQVKKRPPPGSEVLPTKHGVRVFVYRENLLDLDVDAIIHGTNRSLDNSGGLASKIAIAAGPALEVACSNTFRGKRNLDIGDCCVTIAGNLHYKFIIHAVIPVWSFYKPHNQQNMQCCQDDLCRSILNSLMEADSAGARSVALPAVGNGHVPVEMCTAAYKEAVNLFCKKHKHPTLAEIHFVDQDKDILRIVLELFQASKPQVSSPVLPAVQSVIRKSEYPVWMVQKDTSGTLQRNYKLSVCVMKQSFVDTHAAALVSLEDEQFQSQRYDAKAIEIKAGGKYQKKKEKIKKVNKRFQISDVFHTRAGDLQNASYVLHVIAPVADSCTSHDNVLWKGITDCTRACYYQVFKKVDELKLDSVALPSFASGTLQDGQIEELWKICVEEVVKYAKQRKSKSKLTRIILADPSAKTTLFLTGLLDLMM